jgi:hypothetical protein
MEHTLYVIQGQVLTTENGFAGSRQIPTFYLDSAVQGITSEAHALEIAREIIDPMHALILDISAEARTLLTAPF